MHSIADVYILEFTTSDERIVIILAQVIIKIQ